MANKVNKNRGLGRGLSALMSDVPVADDQRKDVPRPDMTVPIDHVFPNPDQPRRRFDSEKLQELSASIATKGIIQPIIVRETGSGTQRYEIVAGERRWRAAQMVPLHDVPVIVREFTDIEVLEVAIIENIQRADLNPIDEAAGYQQLMEKFGHTQAEMAEALGKSRPYIANLTRLLQLPTSVKALLETGKLSAGHARALVGHDRAEALAAQIVAKGLSVREAERLAKKNPASGAGKSGGGNRAREKDADTKAIESELSAQIKMPVSIDADATGVAGKMTITYKSLDQLDDLLRALSGT